MAQQTFRQILMSQVVDGAALSNTTVPTTILHPTARKKFPMNELLWVGAKLIVRAHGRITHPATPGGLTLECRMGPTSNIAIASGGVMALNANAKTNVPWRLEWELECRALGSGTNANFHHQGAWFSEAVVGAAAPAAGGCGVHLLPNAAPSVGTGYDSTVDNIFDLFATWVTAAATYSIQVHGYELELGN